MDSGRFLGTWATRGRGLALTLLLTLTSSCSLGLRIGEKAPTLELPDEYGVTFDWNELRGKVVMLSFWATWCGPCKQELPHLARLDQELGEGVVLVLVSDEDPDDTSLYLKRAGIEAISLADARRVGHRTYGVRALPTLYVIDQSGVIRERTVGYRSGAERDLETLLRDL